MILHVVEIYNYQNIQEWQTVDIWKSRESAEEAIDQYRQNWNDHPTDLDDMPAYRIVEIDTDVDSDCVYSVINEDCEE